MTRPPCSSTTIRSPGNHSTAVGRLNDATSVSVKPEIGVAAPADSGGAPAAANPAINETVTNPRKRRRIVATLPRAAVVVEVGSAG